MESGGHKKMLDLEYSFRRIRKLTRNGRRYNSKSLFAASLNIILHLKHLPISLSLNIFLLNRDPIRERGTIGVGKISNL
jgi:hypothetical protein